MLACCEEMLKEKKRSLSRQTLVLDLCKEYSETRASPLVFVDIGDDNPDDTPTDVLPPQIIIWWLYLICCKFLELRLCTYCSD